MEKLLLSDVRPKYRHHINEGVCIDRFIRFFEGRYQLDFDVYLESKGMNLQRELCWTLLQKQQLILSMLRGIQIPKFVFVEENISEKERIFKVIDGKQRFHAIFEFMRNEFSIEVNGQEYFYADLDKSAQQEIAWTNPKIDVHYSYWNDKISDDTLIDLFEQINFLGTPQDVEHLNKLKQ